MEKNIEAKLEVEVRGLGKIYAVHAPLDLALESLKDRGARIVSLRDLACARIRNGPHSSLSEEGSYVRQGVMYIPNQNPLFISESPILASAHRAQWVHRRGKEFCIKNAEDYLERAEADRKKAPEDRDILILKHGVPYKIPTQRFGEDELTLWAFKDQARAYGDFLSECGLRNIYVQPINPYDVDEHDMPFATQLWLEPLDHNQVPWRQFYIRGDRIIGGSSLIGDLMGRESPGDYGHGAVRGVYGVQEEKK